MYQGDSEKANDTRTDGSTSYLTEKRAISSISLHEVKSKQCDYIRVINYSESITKRRKEKTDSFVYLAADGSSI